MDLNVLLIIKNEMKSNRVNNSMTKIYMVINLTNDM